MADYEVTLPQLQEIAARIGIDAIGVTDAAPFTDLLPHLRRYHEEGRDSGFEHPVPEERIHPRSLLPEAQSLISIAVSYRTHATKRAKRLPGRRGMVSIYSWGQDYHRVLKQKLQSLARELERLVGRPISTVTAVDTTALVDRAVAARAGVGWIGKNCSIITASHGSWVFLGTLITDVVFAGSDNDRVRMDECGDCDLCLTACPTGALTAPYVIDAKQCLSYVTQMKGIIPERYRAALGRRVWGCDTCQTVCPKNKISVLGLEHAFTPDPDLAFPDLYGILSMSRRTFTRVYGHTAAAWRGANVWRRNALIALGNIRDPAALPLVLEMLRDPRPEIRASAAWAIRQTDLPAGRRQVREAFAREEDPDVRKDMAWAADDECP